MSDQRILTAAALLTLAVGARAQTTFYPRIAAIIQANCVTCHNPQGEAPFSLMRYEDVAKRGRFVKSVVQRRYMPPWKADPHYSTFSNQRILADSDIRLICEWVDAGMPKGVPAAGEGAAPAPVLPNFVDLRMNGTYTVPGDNTDHFIVFKVPFEFADTMDVAGIVFRPTARKVVHHANYGFYEVGPGVDLNLGRDRVDLGDSSNEFYQFDTLTKRMVYYSGWIPGTTIEEYPPGMGWTLPKRGVMLLYVHFAPTPVPETFSGEVELIPARTPVRRKVQLVNIGSAGVGDIDPPLVIRANTISTFTATIRTTHDQSILYVWPHMHLLGKSYLAYAVTPAGDTIHLIRIPSWDFNWQEMYRFPHLVHIPAGSVIRVEGTYDNTADNPRNPNNPPRLVFSDSHGYMRTSDEMLNLLLLYLPYEPGDEKLDIGSGMP